MASEDELEAKLSELDAEIAEVADDPGRRARLAWCRQERARTLGRLKRFEESSTAFDEFLKEFTDDDDREVAPIVDRGFYNRAWFRKHERVDDGAVEAVEEALTRYAEVEPRGRPDLVAKTLHLKAFVLWKLDRVTEALETYEYMLSRFGDSEETPVRRALCGALVERAQMARGSERHELALQAADDVIARFGNDEDDAIRDEVLDAMWERGTALQGLTVRVLRGKVRALGQAGRGGEIVAVADQAFRIFGSSAEPSVRAALGPFVHDEVWWLLEGGLVNDAIAECERLLVLFQGEPDQEVVLADSQALCRCARSLVAPARGEGVGRRKLVRVGSALIEPLSHVAGSANLVPASVGRHALAKDIATRRRKLAEAIRLCDGVVERLHTAADDDSQALLVMAAVHRAGALIDAGQLGQGVREVGRILNGGRGEAAKYVLAARLHLAQSPRQRLKRRLSNQR